MFRHLITSINYPKLIEEQANKAAFGEEKRLSKKVSSTSPKAKVKTKINVRTNNK